MDVLIFILLMMVILSFADKKERGSSIYIKCSECGLGSVDNICPECGFDKKNSQYKKKKAPPPSPKLSEGKTTSKIKPQPRKPKEK